VRARAGRIVHTRRSVEAPDRLLIGGRPLPRTAAGAELGRLVLDRGLHFGDGLFETIACVQARPRLVGYHLERLQDGCTRLGLPAPDRAALRAEIEQMARGAERALIKVLYTRGSATARGYAPRGDEEPRRILLRYGWPREDARRSGAGVAVAIADSRLGENPRLAGLKHLNRLELVLARAELRGSRCAEALLFSSSGSLVSGTMSNVFIVQGPRVRTPRLDRCGVAGVMRRAVMHVARSDGIVVEEAPLGRSDLDSATEIFLTNARIGIWPVRELDGRCCAVGPLTRHLQRLLVSRLAEARDA